MTTSEDVNILELIDMNNIPEHIGIIMDGNRRWSKKNNKLATSGHMEGAKTLQNMCKYAEQIGVKYLTVYAFSTENWKRSKLEIDFLMNLLREYLKKFIRESISNNMKVAILGDRTRLSKDILASIDEMEGISKTKTGLQLNIALNYGGRDEILRAVKKIGNDIKNGVLDIDTINENLFNEYLDTKNIPDPELIIRTSGEKRLSNFLLWQIAYSEFYFFDKFWPEFTKEDLYKIIYYYQKRERRFGGA